MPSIKVVPKTVATSAHAHTEPTIVVGPAVYAVEPTITVGPAIYAVAPTITVGPAIYAVAPTITVGPAIYAVAPSITVGPAIYAVAPSITVGPAVYATQPVVAGTSTSSYTLGSLDPQIVAPVPVTNFIIEPPVQPMVPGYIGDKVFLDANGNGRQDAGEAGIAGQTVELYRKGADRIFGTADDQLVATQVTDADGHYQFTHMFGHNNLFLDSTIYQVKVTPTAGYGFTKQDAGDDNLDSDFSADGRSQTISIGWGQNITSVDAGLVKLDQHNASIGDKVWNDVNRNGIQDAGESGLANQPVSLVGAGADKLLGTADDVLQSAMTDANGHYAFTGLAAGDYKVEFAAVSVGSWGWDLSKAHVGTDAAIDSNTAYPEVIHLAAGENNTTVDGGLYYWTNPQFEIPHVGDDTPYVILGEPTFTLPAEIIVGPNTPTPMPYIQLGEPTFTLPPEILAKASSFMAGLPLLQGSDDLLNNAFGAPVHSAAAAAGETMGHAGDIMRQLLTTMDSHAASTVAMA